MAMDETMIDAPVTPAPIFAYRALKGIFFGSPDTPQIARDAQNKHDIEAVIRKSPTKKLQLLEGQVRLTPPQKRKRDSSNVLSPTKSCLRTPGAATPRKAFLRDLTVTFKDPRTSISPELLKKGTEVHLGLDTDKENQKPVQVKCLPDVGVRIALGQSPTFDVIDKVSTAVPSKEEPPIQDNVVVELGFNMEEYMAKTDKEMKKLIRYGKKMRDYARKQDEENVKLKEVIAILRTENERLREGRTSSSVASAGTATAAGMKLNAVASRRLASSTFVETGHLKTAARANSHEHDKEDRLALDELLNLDKDISKTRSTSKHFQLQPRSQAMPSKPGVEPNSSTSPASQKLLPTESPTKRLAITSNKVMLEASKTADDTPPNQPHTAGTSTMTRLETDRLQAARARIQKRAELRKPSAGSIAAKSSAAVCSPRARIGREMEMETGSSKENSLVDWAAL